MLRKAMEDYENSKFVAKSENATLGRLLDISLADRQLQFDECCAREFSVI